MVLASAFEALECRCLTVEQKRLCKRASQQLHLSPLRCTPKQPARTHSLSEQEGRKLHMRQSCPAIKHHECACSSSHSLLLTWPPDQQGKNRQGFALQSSDNLNRASASQRQVILLANPHNEAMLAGALQMAIIQSLGPMSWLGTSFSRFLQALAMQFPENSFIK